MTDQTGDVLAAIDAVLGWHGTDPVGPDAMRWAPEVPPASERTDTQLNLKVHVAWEVWRDRPDLAERMVLEHWYRYAASAGAMAMPGTQPRVDVGSFPPVDEHGHITVVVVGRVVPAH